VDEHFRMKALKKIQNIFKGDGTIMISTHYMDFLRKNCRTVVWLDKGVIKITGNVLNVINRYSK